MPERSTATNELAKSAKVLTESAVEQTDSADRRTELAANRTVMASERTYAAWIRTGIATLASGLGAEALLVDHVADWISNTVATGLLLISAVCFGISIWRVQRPGAMPPAPDIPQIPTLLLSTVGAAFLVLVALAIIVVWLA